MAQITLHNVPSLPPEAYQIKEARTGDTVRFIPQMRGRGFPWSRSSGKQGIAYFDTLAEAQDALISFVSRMQDAG